MREIKFRGKMTDANEWIYGTLLIIPHPPTVFATGKAEKDKYYIQFADPRYMPDWNMPYRMVQGEVNPDTVGQYTGLKDKNGTEIYEGDIVELDKEGRLLFGTKEHPSRKYQLVGFRDGAFMTGRSNIDYKDLNTFLWIIKDYIIVVGNIYDNPELLKGEENG